MSCAVLVHRGSIEGYLTKLEGLGRRYRQVRMKDVNEQKVQEGSDER